MTGLFDGLYEGRRILVTGHTGFVGYWATRWLLMLGASVTGYSRGRYPPVYPASGQVSSFAGDITDAARLADVMAEAMPEIVIHLAGSATVAAGFRAPLRTLESNVIGTAAVLDAAMHQGTVRSVVAVSTLAASSLGDDLALAPYPASKIAAEAVVAAYAHAMTLEAAGRTAPLGIGVARPGVMIGGDWGEGRLLADVVRAVRAERPVVLSAPSAVRPWQHVLDGISGVLTLAARLWGGRTLRRRYDFGRRNPQDAEPVRELVERFLTVSGVPGWPIIVGRGGAEDRIELGCAAAAADISWQPAWDLGQALEATGAWYRAADEGPAALLRATDEIIASYATDAAPSVTAGRSAPPAPSPLPPG